MQRQLGLPHLPKRSDRVPRRNQQIESEASKLRAKVALDGGEFGAMEIVTHGTDDFTTYINSLYKIDIRNTTQK